MLFKGLFYIFNEVARIAEDELTDPEPVRRELSDLYRSFENGDITEQEFEERERVLIERLDQIENYREEHYGQQ